MAINLQLYFSAISRSISDTGSKDLNDQMQTANIISWATNDVGSSKTFYTFNIDFWQIVLGSIPLVKGRNGH